MNTANLQLEGLLLAFASLIDVLKARGALTDKDVSEALSTAEASAAIDPARPSELSAANIDAIHFPIRFLRVAVSMPPEARSFTAIATQVGQTKPPR